MADPTKNFGKVTVSTTYGSGDTSIVLSSGNGAKLPDPAVDGAYNLVWWNSTDYDDPADDPNVEIVRVTVRSTDTLTVTRAQEGTSASAKNTSGKTYKMLRAFTKKDYDDLVAQIVGNGGNKIETNISQVTKTNSTTSEQTIYTTTIPANVLGSNEGIELKIPFKYTSSIAGNTLRLKLGSATMATVALPDNSNVTKTGIIRGYIANNDSTQAQKGVLQAMTVDGASIIETGTATEDTTTDLTLSVTIQYSTTGSSASIQAEAFFVSKVSSALGVNGLADGNLVSIDSSQQTTGTLYSIPIPAGTLGDSNGIRFTLPLSVITLANSTAGGVQVALKYGTTTLATAQLKEGAGNGSYTGKNGFVTGMLYANASENAQKGFIVFSSEDEEVSRDSNPYGGTNTKYGSSSEDSSTDLNLEIVVTLAASCGITAEGIIVEKITDTLNGLGSLDEKFVGVGSRNQTYWTKDFPFGAVYDSGGGSIVESWSFANVNPSYESLAFSGSGAAGSTASLALTLPENSKEVIMQIVCQTDTSTSPAGAISFIGFAPAEPTKAGNEESIGFLINTNGDWYIRAADGSGNTETAISSPTNSARHVFRVEADFDNSVARYYIDGVLVGTISTDLPTTADELWIGNGDSDEYVEIAWTPSVATKL